MANWLKINRSSTSATPTSAAAGVGLDTKGLLVHPSAFIPIDGAGHTTELRLSGDRAALASVVCYAAINYRMRKVAEPPLYVADETANGEPWVQNHPLAQLLEMPNPDQEMADLLMETQLTLDIDRGMALWLIERDRLGRPARLRCYGGNEFSVKPANGLIYGQFRIQTTAGPVERGPQDVVFFRYPHPDIRRRWEGLSPTDALLSRLGIEADLVTAIKAGLRNAIIPSLAIVHPKDAEFTPEQWREYKASIREDYSSTLNNAKPLLARGGATVTKLALGFKGLEGGALNEEMEAAACMAFGTRPELLACLIGLKNAPWSHMRDAQRFSYEETIIPLWQGYARGITRQLLRQTDQQKSRKVKFDTSGVRALQADQERGARVSTLVARIATRNQRRQLAGLEPMRDDPEYWNAVEEREPRAAAAGPTKRAVPASKGSASRWALFDAAARAAETGWEMAAAAQLAADRDAVLGMAARILRTGKDDGIAPADPASARELARQANEHFRSAPVARAWRERVEPLAARGAAQGAEWAAADLGISFDLAVPGATAFAERHSAWAVTEITRTTRTAVAEAVADSIEAGESVAQLTRRIQDAGAFSRNRALLIARTESTAVLNGAQWASISEYAKTNGATVTKTWLAAMDDRVRDEHADLNGESVPVNEAFSNGLQHPGEPNCRCTLTYAVED